MTFSKEPRALAVHSGALGDVILFGRLLDALDAPVTLVTGGEKGRLLESMGVVEDSLDFDALPMHEVFSDAPLEDCRLPALLGPHDMVISFFAGGNKRAERRLGEMCGAYATVFLPIRPEEFADNHIVDIWFDMTGMEEDAGDRPWPVAGDWSDEARRMLTGLGVPARGPYVVVHPGAGAPDKCWPLENFITAAGKLDQPAVFVVGPVELDRWGEQAIEDLRRQVPLAVCPPLTTLAGLLAEADAYVGNDSGVTHLAAAVGAPTIALFGKTLPQHFCPRGPRVIVATGDPMTRILVDHVVSDVGFVTDD